MALLLLIVSMLVGVTDACAVQPQMQAMQRSTGTMLCDDPCCEHRHHDRKPAPGEAIVCVERCDVPLMPVASVPSSQMVFLGLPAPLVQTAVTALQRPVEATVGWPSPPLSGPFQTPLRI